MHFFKQLQVPKSQYHPLDFDDESSDAAEDGYLIKGHSSRALPKRVWWQTMLTYAFVAALALALTAVSTLYARLVQEHKPKPLLTCGDSIAEAQRRGCTFDRLTKAWLPAECPRYYEQEFVHYPAQLGMNITEWQYWTDLKQTTEVTDKEMAVYAESRPLHNDSWVSTARMHLAHCAFVLMRRADEYENGERRDATTEHVPHLKHCVQMLLEAAMDSPHVDKVNSVGEVGFGAC